MTQWFGIHTAIGRAGGLERNPALGSWRFVERGKQRTVRRSSRRPSHSVSFKCVLVEDCPHHSDVNVDGLGP
jgi:hypothetical protein